MDSADSNMENARIRLKIVQHNTAITFRPQEATMAYQLSPNRIAAQSPGFYRVWHITGDKKRGIEPILPIGRSTFLAGVAAGKYPQPVKLGERTSAWRKADILALLETFEPVVDGEAA